MNTTEGAINLTNILGVYSPLPYGNNGMFMLDIPYIMKGALLLITLFIFGKVLVSLIGKRR